jgi:hypothetical protein
LPLLVQLLQDMLAMMGEVHGCIEPEVSVSMRQCISQLTCQPSPSETGGVREN